MYAFVGKHLPEIFALLATAVIVVLGSYLAWNYEAVWLNRAGALVIIAGVLLAASRFHEKVHARALSSIEQHYDALIAEISATLGSSGRPSNEGQEKKLRESMLPAIRSAFVQSLDNHKKRIRMWEIWLVIVGTFLNGFGDYLVSLVRSTYTS